MLRDPDVALWNPGPDQLDLDEAREWCRRGADWSGGDHATFSALDATTGRLLGNVSLHKIDHEQHGRRDRLPRRAVGPGPGRGNRGSRRRLAVGIRGARPACASRPATRSSTSRPAGWRRRPAIRWRARCGSRFVYGDGRRYDEHLHARLASDPDPRPDVSGRLSQQLAARCLEEPLLELLRGPAPFADEQRARRRGGSASRGCQSPSARQDHAAGPSWRPGSARRRAGCRGSRTGSAATARRCPGRAARRTG